MLTNKYLKDKALSFMIVRILDGNQDYSYIMQDNIYKYLKMDGINYNFITASLISIY